VSSAGYQLGGEPGPPGLGLGRQDFGAVDTAALIMMAGCGPLGVGIDPINAIYRANSPWPVPSSHTYRRKNQL
jgi:hypothetical protein